MLPSIYIVFISIISITGLIGILTGAFIVVLNVRDWAKGRSLNTCDRILLALGISGTSFQCSVVTEAYVSLLWNQLCDYILPVLVGTGCCNAWLSAALSIFYCVKIVDFNHPLFFRLKLHLSKAVSWLILVSIFGCLVLTTSGSWNLFQDIPQNSSPNATVDSIIPQCKKKWSGSQFLPIRIYGFSMPLLLGIISIVVILSSLYRHTRRIRENASGFSQPRMEAHFGAARVVGFLMLLYIAMFLAEFVILSLSSLWLRSFLWIVISSSMSAQSVVLILGNTKLRQGLWKLLSPRRKGGATTAEPSVKPRASLQSTGTEPAGLPCTDILER